MRSFCFVWFLMAACSPSLFPPIEFADLPSRLAMNPAGGVVLDRLGVIEFRGAVDDDDEPGPDVPHAIVRTQMRIAVTGGTVSPAIFETLVLLGRESALARIDRCLSARIIASGTS